MNVRRWSHGVVGVIIIEMLKTEELSLVLVLAGRRVSKVIELCGLI